MIVDSFLYFNEKELADLRIKYLNDVVDSFVVIEANVTHQGKAKQWNFSSLLENELKQFKDKIKYHQLKIDINKVTNSEFLNRLNEYRDKPANIQAEEAITLFSDSIKTGDIKFTTVGHASGDTYTIILSLIKEY